MRLRVPSAAVRGGAVSGIVIIAGEVIRDIVDAVGDVVHCIVDGIARVVQQGIVIPLGGAAFSNAVAGVIAVAGIIAVAGA